MLVFHNDSDTSYANYAGNLSSMSSATTAVTLNFASTVGTSASNDSVVLTVTAGQEEAVMEGLAGAFAEARSGMTVIADDKNSKYLLNGITALASISVDNGAGTFDNVVAATFTTADTEGPSLSSSNPTDGATTMGVNSNIVLTFNEAVSVASGKNITIHSGSTEIESIDVTGSKVTGSGSTEITINPDTTLDEKTDYYIKIESGSFEDNSGNPYAGIINNIIQLGSPSFPDNSKAILVKLFGRFNSDKNISIWS